MGCLAAGLKPSEVGEWAMKTYGVSGEANSYKFRSPMNLWALDERGRATKFRMAELYATETPQRIPCLLGRDFFEENRLRLVFDPMKGEVLISDRHWSFFL